MDSSRRRRARSVLHSLIRSRGVGHSLIRSRGVGGLVVEAWQGLVAKLSLVPLLHQPVHMPNAYTSLALMQDS